MKITAIKAQVKNPERVSVYVDDEYSFSLGYSELLEQKVHAGLEIDAARLAELKHISDIGKAFERILQYVMLRPRSLREVQDYCWRKKWAPADCVAIINKLVSKGYINDRAFAKSWVESRALNKTISQRKLRLELKQKGVADDIIAEVLAVGRYDEATALKGLIAKKRRLARFATDDQKLTEYLARQGFRFDDIQRELAGD